MQLNMAPIPAPVYFDHQLTLRGVPLALRVFPGNNVFTLSSGRPLKPAEQQAFVKYLKDEGFFDNPMTGDETDQVTI
jgi:hypothetical protein